MKETMFGVTFDNPWKLKPTVAMLKSLPVKATSRIVFDEGVKATEYVEICKEIQKVSFVMGEILDSFYVPSLTTAKYIARTKEYLTALGDTVDIWEIGNEINGEWLGKTSDVVAKMQGAFDVIKAAKKKTALTLYYNEKCYEKKTNEMFTWANANIPQSMRQGLNYVFISYYEDDCNHAQPDWSVVFKKLAVLFPNSKIGMGECGTTKKAAKEAMVKRYYAMKITEPNYVGGYFWWYGSQDFVGANKPLLKVFSNALESIK